MSLENRVQIFPVLVFPILKKFYSYQVHDTGPTGRVHKLLGSQSYALRAVHCAASGTWPTQPRWGLGLNRLGKGNCRPCNSRVYR